MRSAAEGCQPTGSRSKPCPAPTAARCRSWPPPATVPASSSSPAPDASAPSIAPWDPACFRAHAVTFPGSRFGIAAGLRHPVALLPHRRPASAAGPGSGNRRCPRALTLDGEVEGLDATGVLPPLLRPGMLMSLDAYHTWEREAVATLNDRRLPPSEAVTAISSATAACSEWRPGSAELSAAIEDAFVQARRAAVDTRPVPEWTMRSRASLPRMRSPAGRHTSRAASAPRRRNRPR